MKYILSISIISLTFIVAGAACQKKITTAPASTSTIGTKIHQTTENAFGTSLGISTTTKTTAGTQTADSSIRSAQPSAPSSELKIAPEVSTSYRYLFTGTPSTLGEATVNVLARNPGVNLNLPSSLAANAGLGVMSFGALKNPLVSNVTFRQGDEAWTIDAINGTISMYRETAVSAREPATAEAVKNTPIDSSAVINVAQSFLSDHGFSLSSYGTPLVLNQNGLSIGQAETIKITAPSEIRMETTTATVMFPLVLQGLPVVQSNGDPIGVTVMIESTTNTITSIYGITSLDFSTSAYKAITDWSKIQTSAEQGGVNYYGAPDEKSTTVNLESPDRVLMVSTIYEANRARELYIPAFRFALVNPPDSFIHYVVVPFVQENPTDSQTNETQPSIGSGTIGKPLINP